MERKIWSRYSFVTFSLSSALILVTIELPTVWAMRLVEGLK